MILKYNVLFQGKKPMVGFHFHLSQQTGDNTHKRRQFGHLRVKGRSEYILLLCQRSKRSQPSLRNNHMFKIIAAKICTLTRKCRQFSKIISVLFTYFFILHYCIVHNARCLVQVHTWCWDLATCLKATAASSLCWSTWKPLQAHVQNRQNMLNELSVPVHSPMSYEL